MRTSVKLGFGFGFLTTVVAFVVLSTFANYLYQMVVVDHQNLLNRETALKGEIQARSGVWQTLETLCSQTPGGSCTVGYKQYPDPDRPGEKFTQLFFKTNDGRCFLFDPFGEKIEDCKVLTALVSP